MQTTKITFLFAGTLFEVVSFHNWEVFSLYQISATRGKEAHSSFTIGEGRADVWSVAHAALVACDKHLVANPGQR